MSPDVSLTNEWREMREFLAIAQGLLDSSNDDSSFKQSIGYCCGALCSLAHAISISDPAMRKRAGDVGPSEAVDVLDVFLVTKLAGSGTMHSLPIARKLLDAALGYWKPERLICQQSFSRGDAAVCFATTTSIVNIVAQLLGVKRDEMPSAS